MPLKILLFLLFFIISNTQTLFAQNQTLQTDTTLAFHSERFLSPLNGLRTSNKGMTKFNIKYDLDNLSSKLSLHYDGYKKFTLDGSYLQYTKKIATFGVGAIDRHWSFSDNSSLILSHNARPSKSIFLKLENRFGYNWLPSKSNWSLEIFNGFTESSLNNINPMLFGARAVLSPIEGLDFEFVKTSQWGGKGYNVGISGLTSAIFKDTNDNSNSNINKMAGLGISYLIRNNIMPLRIYGQAIGEDEAGGLPSCYAYLAGLEWSNAKIKYPSTVGIELIDTSTERSTHGYCGKNSIYNNNTYNYTNYGKVMGSEIDTQSTSFGLFLQSQISEKTNIKFTTKSVVINKDNWSHHRLSTKRQSGFINSLTASWSKDNINFNGDIFYQGFSLDKADIKSGYGVGFSSSIMF
jgi:hypothetical protein